MIRRSNVSSKSPLLNRSQNEEEILSNTQSRIIYEQKQNSIVGIIKFLILFIVIIILLLFFRSFMAIKEDDSQIKKSFQKLTEVIEEKVKGKNNGEDDSAGWSWFPSFCENKWSKFEEELKKQRFSVQKFLPVLPDHEEIKNNPKKYNFDEYQAKMKREQFELLEKDPVTMSMNKLLNSGEVNKRSDPELLKKAQDDLWAQNDLFKNQEKLLDDESIFRLKNITQDLTNSQKNLVDKKLRLNKFRNNYFQLMNKLEECNAKNEEFTDDLDKKNSEKDKITGLLKNTDRELESIDQKIKINEANLTDEEKERRRKIKELTDKIVDIKSKLKNEVNIQKDIEKKKSDIEIFLKRIEELKNQIEGENVNLGDYEKQIKDFENDNYVIEKKIQILQKKKRIHEMKLELTLRDDTVKEYLKTLLNGDQKIEDLNDIFKVKIDEEKKLLESLEDFEKIKQTMKGDVIVDHGDTFEEKSNIEIIMKKDEEDLQQITSKYMELKKVLDKYKSGDLEIKMIRKTIKDLDEEIKLEDIKKGKNNRSLDELKNKLLRLRGNIDRNLKEVSALEYKIKEYRQFVFENSEMLKNLRGDLLNYEEQLALIMNEIKEKQSERDSLAENLSKERKGIYERKKDLEQSLNNLEKEIKKVNFDMKSHLDTCVSLRVFYDESVKKLPELEDLIHKDEELIQKLRMKLKEEINSFNDF
jgi:chromosome segregation ATPase